VQQQAWRCSFAHQSHHSSTPQGQPLPPQLTPHFNLIRCRAQLSGCEPAARTRPRMGTRMGTRDLISSRLPNRVHPVFPPCWPSRSSPKNRDATPSKEAWSLCTHLRGYVLEIVAEVSDRSTVWLLRSLNLPYVLPRRGSIPSSSDERKALLPVGTVRQLVSTAPSEALTDRHLSTYLTLGETCGSAPVPVVVHRFRGIPHLWVNKQPVCQIGALCKGVRYSSDSASVQKPLCPVAIAPRIAPVLWDQARDHQKRHSKFIADRLGPSGAGVRWMDCA